MMVNNETGYILPVRRAFYGIKKMFPQCITHTDAVQGFMKIPFKVSELNADIVSLSGHKIHAGKGVGALYLKKESGWSRGYLEEVRKREYVQVLKTYL